MADQARVESVEALAAFRASLLVYLEKAHRALDEMSDEVRRTRGWIQQEQRPFWQREIRRRQNLLDLAEQELMTARLSGLRDNIQRQQEAARRGRMAVEEAEEKARAVRRWTRDFDHDTTPLLRQIQGVRQMLEIDFPKAVNFLLAAQSALEAYAEVQPNRRHIPAPVPLPPPEPGNEPAL